MKAICKNRLSRCIMKFARARGKKFIYSVDNNCYQMKDHEHWWAKQDNEAHLETPHDPQYPTWRCKVAVRRTGLRNMILMKQADTEQSKYSNHVHRQSSMPRILATSRDGEGSVTVDGLRRRTISECIARTGCNDSRDHCFGRGMQSGHCGGNRPTWYVDGPSN